MKRCLIVLPFLLVILSGTLSVSAQDGEFRPSRSEAEAAWNTGNYESAFRHFNGLLLLYSRDPLYKYYTGACLVMLDRDPSRAVSLLASAINSSMNVKSVPDDVWFYYGRALQQSGRYTEAGESLGKFVKVVGKRKASEYETQTFIDMCGKGKGESGLGQIVTGKEPGEVKTNIGEKNVEKEKANPVNAEESVQAPYNDILKDSTVKVVVPEGYDTKLGTALRLQFTADSLNRMAQSIRRIMETAEPGDKASMRLRAEAIEKDANLNQAEADKIFLTLEPEERPALRDDSMKDSEDGREVISNNTDGKINDNAIIPAEPLKVVKGQPVFSVFAIKPVPAYEAANPVPTGKGAMAGLVYRIQLAAFKNPVPASHFKGLSPLYGKIKPENGVTYYYAGMFRTIESAREALARVRTSGFPDAFVAAMMDDNLVSMERAAALEKEQSGEPLFYNESAAAVPKESVVSDTVNVMTLFFRAEVMRSKKPVKPEVIEKIGLLAGRRGLEIVKNDHDETLYLVGKFITFESAQEYVSLLIRNGYSTARVVAYVGDREITVEAANELLKKLVND